VRNGHRSIPTSPTYPSYNLPKNVSIHNCIAVFRDSATVDVSPIRNNAKETFAQAKQILESRPSSHPAKHNDIFQKGRVLPSHLSSAFRRPDIVDDVLIILSAIAALVVSCEACFASDTAGRVWQSAAMWFTKLPEHFNDVMKSENPAALIVLAHWVMLLQRAESCGCWYLTGMARRNIDEISERVGVENGLVRNLVVGLMSGGRIIEVPFPPFPFDYRKKRNVSTSPCESHSAPRNFIEPQGGIQYRFSRL
jgi:hypothetical protein